MSKLILLLALCLTLGYGVDSIAGEDSGNPAAVDSYQRLVKREKKASGADAQKKDQVVERLLLKAGDNIADIGAGTGSFTVLLSKKAGEQGKIYAVDIDQRMLDYISARAAKDGLHNIVYILSKPDDPLLPKSSLDMIFIRNTYSFLPKREHYLALLKDALKLNGRLAIVDIYPPPTKPKLARFEKVPKEQVLDEVLKAGFKLDEEFNFLPKQFFLIFSKEREKM